MFLGLELLGLLFRLFNEDTDQLGRNPERLGDVLVQLEWLLCSSNDRLNLIGTQVFPMTFLSPTSCALLGSALLSQVSLCPTLNVMLWLR